MIMVHFEEDSLVDALAGMVPLAATGPRRVAGAGAVLKSVPLRAIGLALASFLVVLALVQGRPSLSNAVTTAALGRPPAVASDQNVIAATRSVLAAAPPPLVVTTTVGRGGTLTSTLDRLGVPAESRDLVVATVRRFIDPRRLLPRTAVAAAFEQGPAGGYRVAVRNEAERFLRVTVLGDAAPFDVRAEVVRLPVVTSVERAGGHVESSVAQALSRSPHGSRLTHAFADVFQWDVDLLIDPRPGDEVRIVYEALRLGTPAIDLPPLEGAPNAEGDLFDVGRILAATYEGRMARSEAYWLADHDGIGSYFDGEGRPLRKTFLRSPLNYRRISSGFSRGRLHPVLRTVVPHHGVDFAAAAGTPVVATADGVVVAAGWDGPLGQCVRVRHGSSFVTLYGHLRGFAAGIAPGVEVKQNQVVGYVGATGRATGPHLHYTLLRSGRPIDPMTFESPASEPLPAERFAQLDDVRRRWLPVIRDIPGMDDGQTVAATPFERMIREGA
jgi:murein DD-endopeptidase MepM/ murein hydrolase activator NlpD